jgi:hypothetical protein
VGMELKDKMVMKTGIYKIVVEVKEIEWIIIENEVNLNCEMNRNKMNKVNGYYYCDLIMWLIW